MVLESPFVLISKCYSTFCSQLADTKSANCEQNFSFQGWRKDTAFLCWYQSLYVRKTPFTYLFISIFPKIWNGNIKS